MKKEANLITSPVLREFYSKALDKKWIVEESLEKRASVSIDKYAVTGNLMQDLVNLASGLREIGLYEQAESLETKFNLFKKAELSLSKLIDDNSRALQEMAHADNAKIVDAQGGWGVVHTNMDRQRKILETLMHEPKAMSEGKQMVHQVALAAANALGLLKFAEGDSVEGKESSDSGPTEAPKEFEFSENSRDEEEFNASATDEEKGKSKKINDKIRNSLEGIFNLFNTIEGVLTEDYIEKYIDDNYSIEKLSTDTTLCSEWDAINKWKAGSTQFVINLNKIKPRIKNIPSQLYKGWNPPDNKAEFDAKSGTAGKIFKEFNIENDPGSKITRKYDSLYASGATGANQIGDDDEFGGIAENPTSIFKWSPAALDDTIEFNVENLTSAIKTIEEDYDKMINPRTKDAYQKVITDILNETRPLITDIQNIKVDLAKTEPVYFSIKKTYDNLYATMQKSKKIIASLKKYKKNILFNKMLGGSIQTLQTAPIDSTLNSLLTEINENPINPLEKMITDEEFGSIAAPLKEARGLYNNYLSDNRDSITRQEEERIKRSIDKILQINTLLVTAKNKGGTIQAFRETLDEPNLKSFSEISSFTNKVKETAENYINKQSGKKAATQKFNLKKSAGILGTNTSPDSSGGSSPRASGGGGGTGGGTGGGGGYKPAALTEGQQAVQRMQYALHQLGSAILSKKINALQKSDPNIIMTVGRTGTAITDFDGNWGANVDRAVKTAKGYVTNLDITPGSQLKTNDSTLEKIADDNYEKIITFLAEKGIASPGSKIEIYDKIPGNLTGTEADDSLLTQEGKILVTLNKISSLRNFYNFINNEIPSFTAGSPTANNWFKLLLWFNNRAHNFARISTSWELRQKSESYYNLLQVLLNKFLTQMKKINIDATLSGDPNSDWNQLALGSGFYEGEEIRGTGRGGSGRDSAGAGAGIGLGGAGGRRGTEAGEILDRPTPGSDSGSKPRSLPFDGDSIYLNSINPTSQDRWFPNSSDLVKKSTFNYRQILENPPLVVAQSLGLFNIIDPFQIQQYYLRDHPNLNPQRNANDDRLYIKPYNYSEYTPLENYPDFIKQKSSYESSYGLQVYKNFLIQLRQEIGPANTGFQNYLDNLVSQGKFKEGDANTDKRVLDTAITRWLSMINNHLIKLGS